eukprot:TRINITY_DN5090_c0_g1_i1.p1 TRINITY_DN5090_c0_g1~~TRINITY_DN5090_c0_g1_i1.p1  ORF type:complete len:506 (+),score=90.39 TRINITY_DN5090_c0_g1_i1:264-1781(+)
MLRGNVSPSFRRSSSLKPKRHSKTQAAFQPTRTTSISQTPIRRDSHAVQSSVTGALTTVADHAEAQTLTSSVALYMGRHACSAPPSQNSTATNSSKQSRPSLVPANDDFEVSDKSKTPSNQATAVVKAKSFQQESISAAVQSLNRTKRSGQTCRVLVTTHGLTIARDDGGPADSFHCQHILCVAQVAAGGIKLTAKAHQQLRQLEQNGGLASLLRRSIRTATLRKRSKPAALAIIVRNQDRQSSEQQHCHVLVMQSQAAIARIESSLQHTLSQYWQMQTNASASLDKSVKEKQRIAPAPTTIPAAQGSIDLPRRRSAKQQVSSVQHNEPPLRRKSRSVSPQMARPRRPSAALKPKAVPYNQMAQQAAALARKRSGRQSPRARQLPDQLTEDSAFVFPATSPTSKNNPLFDFDELDELLFDDDAEPPRRMSRSAPTSPMPGRRRRSDRVSPVLHAARPASSGSEIGHGFERDAPSTSPFQGLALRNQGALFGGMASRFSPGLTGRY